jgi:3-phenylpropionate/trans-cinnamate dioxygenase ferredoxin reductase subunit
VSQTIVIVGAGQAGGWAARTLRQEGYRDRIVLLGEERHAPYERPPLSKGLLAGTAGAEAATIFTPSALSQLEIEWKAPVACQSIHPGERTVRLSDGSAIPYDKLILCTGGHARRLPVPGADLPGVLALRTVDDALSIAARLQAGKRLVAIGGGWIGLEVAAAARAKGMEVAVVEAEARLCARTVPAPASDYLRALHEGRGTRVHLGCGVGRIERGPGDGLAVVLEDGRALPADLVVTGVGLVPNDDLAHGAGLECRGGIVVDASCRTSDERIFAAGDVAVAFNRWYGKSLRLESWQNAQDQGIAAAKAALGMDVAYDPVPRFWSDQYDVTIQMLGCVSRERGVAVVRKDAATGSFMVFCVEDRSLQGVLSVRAAGDYREARRILLGRRPVSAEALADPRFDLADL